jgi:predicted 2-oxoglutarate/Fe(II)-dependent dioxygenase YbiX
MKNLNEFVHKETVFSAEFCDDAIQRLEQLDWKPHRWYGSNKWHDVKDFVTTYDLELMSEMRQPIIDFVSRYEKKYMNVTEFCGVRFNKYSVGEGIAEHVDHIHSLFDGTRKGIPIISIVGVFNDNYEGGEFMLNKEQIDMKQGDVLIFPSCFLYPHMVKPITSGTRYSWVLWGF